MDVFSKKTNRDSIGSSDLTCSAEHITGVSYQYLWAWQKRCPPDGLLIPNTETDRICKQTKVNLYIDFQRQY